MAPQCTQTRQHLPTTMRTRLPSQHSSVARSLLPTLLSFPITTMRHETRTTRDHLSAHSTQRGRTCGQSPLFSLHTTHGNRRPYTAEVLQLFLSNIDVQWTPRQNNCKTKFTGEGGGDTIGEESIPVTKPNGYAEDQSEACASTLCKVKLREASALRV